MSLLDRLLCRVRPDRCAVVIAPPDDSTVSATIHRAAQIETSMHLQAGMLRRQALSLKAALENDDDDAIERVTTAMLRHPMGERMWLDDALTGPRRVESGGQT